MWTPRRILLFLLALLGFGTAYAGYSRFFGAIDGLPQLPDRYLAVVDPGDTPFVPIVIESPTEQRIKEAFGPNCAEQNYTAYPTQLEMREQGMVVAAGRPQWEKEPSRFVKLAPFSIAVFGKPRAPADRVPGEVTEISTIHADIGILEFDQPISSQADMSRGKANFVGLELRSEPDRFSPDQRNGRVFITNNQRSADPNKALVIKTPGPVFYRKAEAPGQPPDAPQVWTAAAVQIENRENMPRPLRGQTLAAVPTKSDDGIVGPVVEGMLLGTLTPPPTVTAEGMKIYLKAPPPKTASTGPAAKKSKDPAIGGIRLIELTENVLLSLWTDGAAGFPGSAAQATEPSSTPRTKPDDPPFAAGAVVGGLGDAGVIGQRLTKKALVRIRTLGSFKFDYDTNAARFEVSPQANPLVPNNVEVTRLTAADGRDILVCQLLELELDGPLTQGGPPPATDKQKAATQRARATGPSFKAVRATGSYVYLFSAADQLEAQGNSLVYRTGIADPRTPKGTITQTVLTGAPLVSVRQKNKLEAGRTGLDGRLVLTTTEPQPGAKSPAQTVITVLGPGRVELYDAATKATSLRASWTESLTHAKDTADKKDLDLFVFAGGGRFEDPKGTFDLSADTLRLWLQPSTPATKDKEAGQPLPFRLQGVGHVAGKSVDAVIKDTDTLNMWFQDVLPPVVPKAVEPPKPTVVAVAPAPPPTAQPQVAQPPANPARPPAPEPQKGPPPPMHLTARSIEAWVSRYPDPTPAKKDAATPGLKYEIDRARLEDRVLVTQAPADPAKNPNGTTITGATLNLTHFPAGHAMTVVGTPDLLAEVRFESVWLAGPKVDIHQPNNTVDVAGRGWLKMPSGSGLNGEALDKPSELNVAWAERMKFQGERRSAEFLGQVQAEQRVETPANPKDPKGRPTVGRSYALCHRMDVGFDRPVMFNQLKSDRKPADNPKIETLVCSPAAEDGDGSPVLARAAVPVVFAEETFAAGTSKPVKAQRITARGIDVKTTPTSSLMTASGPGESRTLQLGSADYKQQPGDPNARTANKPPAEEEMKLTVVRFVGRLRVDDRKGIFQQAVFTENVRVVNTPTEDINAPAEEVSPPPRSLTLKCTDTLTVSSYRGANGGEGRKEMLAVGGAQVKDDAYIGLGHEVAYDGTLVTLTGHNEGQATLYRRQRTADGQDYNSGRKISYDTRTGRVNAIDSSGGSVTGGK